MNEAVLAGGELIDRLYDAVQVRAKEKDGHLCPNCFLTIAENVLKAEPELAAKAIANKDFQVHLLASVLLAGDRWAAYGKELFFGDGASES